MDAYILYGKCLIAVTLGLVIHTASKFQELYKLHVTANEPLTLSEFLRMTIVSHVINVACVAMWMLALPDFIRAMPTIYGSEFAANVVHIFICGTVGYANSSIILKVFGSGKRYILTKIDQKTNVADEGNGKMNAG
jgi:hypothetical protein